MIPRITAMLKVFEPTTLPTARSPLPRAAAVSEVHSSGVEVPNPTIVSPMKKLDSPSRRATDTAPRTRSSAPPVSTTSDTASRPTFNSM